MKKIEEWQKSTLGKTMYAKRRAILKPDASEKVDRNSEETIEENPQMVA